MKQLILCTLALVTSLALAAASPGRDDAKAIQGTWKPVRAEIAGHRMAESITKLITLKLTDGAYTVTVRDGTDKGTYKIDPSTKPKSITITGTDGPNKDKTFAAIYELDGDTLKICYDLSARETPKDFKTEAGTKLYLVTYERQKE